MKAKTKALQDLKEELKGNFKNKKRILKVSASRLDTKEVDRLNRALGII